MKRYLRLVISVLVGLALRLIPFRAPNIEPILALQMPAAKRFGSLAGFATGFGSIVLYDFVTMTGGRWSWHTALTYGVIGAAAPLYFKHRDSTALNYAKFAVVSTLVFDFITGVVFGPVAGIVPSYEAALVGQIPFTILHLIGNVTLAAVLSPLLHAWYEAAESPVGLPVFEKQKDLPL